jgi:hypothetical protein
LPGKNLPKHYNQRRPVGDLNLKGSRGQPVSVMCRRKNCQRGSREQFCLENPRGTNFTGVSGPRSQHGCDIQACNQSHIRRSLSSSIGGSDRICSWDAKVGPCAVCRRQCPAANVQGQANIGARHPATTRLFISLPPVVTAHSHSASADHRCSRPVKVRAPRFRSYAKRGLLGFHFELLPTDASAARRHHSRVGPRFRRKPIFYPTDGKATIGRLH